MIRAAIVEDEVVARETLRRYIDGVPWVSLVGEAADGTAAIEMIDALRPDVVLLDVQLPELDGLKVLQRIVHRPHVIFTTAHDRYAVTAFELQALDYLLKPFDRTRCLAALERVRNRSEDATVLPRMQAAVSEDRLERLFVRDRAATVPVVVNEITRLEADDDYTALYVGHRRHLVQIRMQDFEARLDPATFVRIHRRHIVNLKFVKAIRSHDGSRMSVEMQDGTRIVASRARSPLLRESVATPQETSR